MDFPFSFVGNAEVSGKRKHFKAVRCPSLPGSPEVKVGSIVMVSDGSDGVEQGFVALVDRLWIDGSMATGRPMLRMRWFFRPGDTVSPPTLHSPTELFLSDLRDDNQLHTVLSVAGMSFPDGGFAVGPKPGDKLPDGTLHLQFQCWRSYNPKTHTFSSVSRRQYSALLRKMHSGGLRPRPLPGFVLDKYGLVKPAAGGSRPTSPNDSSCPPDGASQPPSPMHGARDSGAGHGKRVGHGGTAVTPFTPRRDGARAAGLAASDADANVILLGSSLPRAPSIMMSPHAAGAASSPAGAGAGATAGDGFNTAADGSPLPRSPSLNPPASTAPRHSRVGSAYQAAVASFRAGRMSTPSRPLPTPRPITDIASTHTYRQWATEEALAFCRGYNRYGKDFVAISRALNLPRSAVVEFYFLNKYARKCKGLRDPKQRSVSGRTGKSWSPTDAVLPANVTATNGSLPPAVHADGAAPPAAPRVRVKTEGSEKGSAGAAQGSSDGAGGAGAGGAGVGAGGAGVGVGASDAGAGGSGAGTGAGAGVGVGASDAGASDAGAGAGVGAGGTLPPGAPGKAAGGSGGADAAPKRAPGRRAVRQAASPWCTQCNVSRSVVLLCSSAKCGRSMCRTCFAQNAAKLRARAELPTFKSAWLNPFWLCLGCCPPLRMSSAGGSDTHDDDYHDGAVTTSATAAAAKKKKHNRKKPKRAVTGAKRAAESSARGASGTSGRSQHHGKRSRQATRVYWEKEAKNMLQTVRERCSTSTFREFVMSLQAYQAGTLTEDGLVADASTMFAGFDDIRERFLRFVRRK